MENFGTIKIRKWHLVREEVLHNEFGIAADGEPLQKLGIAAVVTNPYAGRYVENLDDVVRDSEWLGEQFVQKLDQYLAGAEIQSYGKACIVGIAGEYEHGNAFITTRFADPIRARLGGAKAWIPSTGKRSSAGASIDVPLAHMNALYVRSHYDTLSVSIADSPAPDEIVIVCAFATRGRLHARLGGLSANEVKGNDGLY
ncbi:peptide synthetase [Pandoraea cepalis]|uniref:Peptide synthetase n=1 Tax=Pandoraea cepalis TaxID=2508294 RepID=A0A5E4WZX1_9BURK|nr:amino acid synthesis family protein [Pandoraea cepalis]VVE29563.1 peptide synthetase [Pandoraea cepalis]